MSNLLTMSNCKNIRNKACFNITCSYYNKGIGLYSIQMVNKDKKVERKRGEDTAKSCGSDSNPGLCFLAMWQMGACSPPEINQHNLCAFSCVRAFSSEKEALGEVKEHDILLRCRWHCLFPLCFCFFGKGDPFSDDKMSV